MSIEQTDMLFWQYYENWISVYKEGAIRDVTLNKYKLTLKWLKELAPELKAKDINRITYAQYEKETDRKPFIGITQDESFRRERQYARTGCNVFDGKHPQSKPLGFWTKQDILRYVKENNLEYCSVYGEINKIDDEHYYNTGEARTGCMFCLFGVHMEQRPNRIQRLAETHPQIYDYIMRGGKYDENGILRPDKGLGYRKLQDAFGLDLEPFEQTTLL